MPRYHALGMRGVAGAAEPVGTRTTPEAASMSVRPGACAIHLQQGGTAFAPGPQDEGGARRSAPGARSQARGALHRRAAGRPGRYPLRVGDVPPVVVLMTWGKNAPMSRRGLGLPACHENRQPLESNVDAPLPRRPGCGRRISAPSSSSVRGLSAHVPPPSNPAGEIRVGVSRPAGSAWIAVCRERAAALSRR